MAKVTVDSGICGFRTVIRASSQDMQHVELKLSTGCPNLKPLTAEALEVDAYVECFSKLGQSPLADSVRAHCKHPGCPVYSGVIKATEVAAGLALPKDVSIHVSRDEE